MPAYGVAADPNLPRPLIRWRAQRSLHPGTESPLYGWAGFPQAVQGKPGENHGESTYLPTLFLFSNLQI